MLNLFGGLKTRAASGDSVKDANYHQFLILYYNGRPLVCIRGKISLQRVSRFGCSRLRQ